MTPDTRGLLPGDVREELLRRWSEPHRHYHGISHLVDGLAALDALGGSTLERIAFWFHDAVHSNTTPDDERASAALVVDLLEGQRSPADIAEIQRLVLLTAGHVTGQGDSSGQRICDADLSALGADDEVYRRNVRGIRAELPHLSDAEWVLGRSAFLSGFLDRDHFFATVFGRQIWEIQARANMRRELQELRAACTDDVPKP
ncbi:MAG: metal-dependent phosphohydrolase [Propionibacteriaceae bacterium]|nr:metal-dependent phosphohydrolase [Propionibacteriaceae bacterium]